MNFRHLILISLLLILAAFPLRSFAQTDTVAMIVRDTIYIKQSCALCDSVEAEKRRKLATDSLFHALRPDSVSELHFLRHPMMTNMPNIFMGFRSVTPSNALFRVAPFSLYNAPENSVIPEWLSVVIRADRLQEDLHYLYMINNPDKISASYSDLPQPIVVPDDKVSFIDYINNLNIHLTPMEMKARKMKLEHINWLHYFNVGLQFSQAYVSHNWYQGGNNYVALLFNFVWNVDLNTVYHPNLLFQSALSYKLGINSNPKEAVHKYSISQDNFQYNLKAGFKAFKHWFYSATLQFKTPLFDTYPQDSYVRSGALLSPGSLNVGLGMTYTRENAKKTFKFSASIAPLSYNLKTCLADDIDHLQYNIKANRTTASEFGSNAEANMMWKISSNVTWSSRMFLFTDYSYFQADWENTFNCQFSRFFSTQLYLHPRYDSSSDFNASKWHYWMLKEILSIGLSYTFSTK